MKLNIIIILLLSLTLFGFADCSSSLAVFRYNMLKCPPDDYSISEQVDGDVKIKSVPLSVNCNGFKEYKFYKGEGTHSIYSGIKKTNSTCRLYVVIHLIGANLNPEKEDILKIAEPVSNTFVENIFQKQEYLKNFNSNEKVVINGLNNLNTWCSQLK